MARDGEFLGEADRILQAADRSGITLRLLGSIAIRTHCDSARKQLLNRAITDLDFVGRKTEKSSIENLFKELKYEPNEMFNALHGSERLKFSGNGNLGVDIFLGVFSMCHVLDFSDRLHLDYPTLTLADMLMTKLQVVELNEKDVKDVVYLLMDHKLGENDSDRESVNIRYVGDVCGRDWGTHKTFSTNIETILKLTDNYVTDINQRIIVKERLNGLLEAIVLSPKTLGWKLRARVGERKRWYELPS